MKSDESVSHAQVCEEKRTRTVKVRRELGRDVLNEPFELGEPARFSRADNVLGFVQAALSVLKLFPEVRDLVMSA